eukprot:CAMPEP_0206307240 /NCGR_PEP_ID=MMETSP0106_2-20121207/11225_1 /ASSEMBLY_ACC=CAM_ASM_000206 /TAXON_ID=81532 /ORGANISM="Acanthoeca-like sp., Strain 10tr" /LENGTH=111 /DNA_ID=CAMNT_0053738209 /DNA_START=67 /DNA_END=398 /DNA_ORIENTATION=-
MDFESDESSDFGTPGYAGPDVCAAILPGRPERQISTHVRTSESGGGVAERCRCHKVALWEQRGGWVGERGGVRMKYLPENCRQAPRSTSRSRSLLHTTSGGSVDRAGRQTA